MKLAAMMTLDEKGFVSPLSRVRSALGSTAGQIAALTGGALSVAGTFAGVKKALDLGGELSDLNAITGISVGKLMVLQQAFEDTGVGAHNLSRSMSMMQRNLANIGTSTEGTQAIEFLGLSLEELEEMDPAAQFETIGKAIGSLDDPAKQSAASMYIFGRSGAQLKTLFADPAAFETARRSLGGLPAIMEQNAFLFDAVSDAMGRVKQRGNQLFAGIAKGVAPVLKEVTDSIDDMDFSQIGLKIGDALAVGVEIIRSGNLGAIVGGKMVVGFKNGLNFLLTGLKQTGIMLATFYGDKGLWKGIVDVAKGAFMGLMGTILKVFAAPLAYLKAGIGRVFEEVWEWLGKIPGMGKLLGVEDYEARSFGDLIREEMEKTEAASGLLLGAAGENLKSGGQAYLDAVQKALNAAQNADKVKLFDTEEDERTIQGLIDAARNSVDARRQAILGSLEPDKEKGGAASPMDAVKAEKAKTAIEMDRWAKMGLFASGGQTAADYNRRIASGMEQAVRLLAKMVEREERGGRATAVVG